jgi:hypothetical protein
MQKNEILMEISSPVEGREGAEVPPRALNSMVQSLSADQSQSIAVENVGQSHLRSTVHQQHGKECDHKEMEVPICLKQLNSTMIQEGGKQLDVDGTEMCVIQPSSTTVQESISQSNFNEVEVHLVRLSSAVVQKYDRQSDVKEREVYFKQPNSNRVEECGKQSNDIAVTLVDPPDAVPVTEKALSLSLPNYGTSLGHSSCDINELSCAPVKTVLHPGETSALVSTTNFVMVFFDLEVYDTMWQYSFLRILHQQKS